MRAGVLLGALLWAGLLGAVTVACWDRRHKEQHPHVSIIPLMEYTAGFQSVTGLLVMIEKEQIPHDAPDPASLGVDGFFTNGLSPDGHCLALPLGRFAGFCVYHVDATLADKLNHQEFYDVVTMCFRDPDDGRERALYHEFGKWLSTTTFVFSAGASHSSESFRYNVSARAVLSTNAVFTRCTSAPASAAMLPRLRQSPNETDGSRETREAGSTAGAQPGRGIDMP